MDNQQANYQNESTNEKFWKKLESFTLNWAAQDFFLFSLLSHLWLCLFRTLWNTQITIVPIPSVILSEYSEVILLSCYTLVGMLRHTRGDTRRICMLWACGVSKLLIIFLFKIQPEQARLHVEMPNHPFQPGGCSIGLNILGMLLIQLDQIRE